MGQPLAETLAGNRYRIDKQADSPSNRKGCHTQRIIDSRTDGFENLRSSLKEFSADFVQRLRESYFKKWKQW